MGNKTKKRNKGCDGKIKYDSIDEARKAIIHMTKRKKRSGNKIVSYMNVYGCSCGKFHIGKTKEIRWRDI